MRKRAEVLARLEARRDKVLAELHPLLRARVTELLDLMDGRVSPWCGYRGPADQLAALEAGNSRARFGESPHNFRPALACDVVLHPARVHVRPHPVDVESPDLWDDESEDALATWAALDHAAERVGLDRVSFMRRGVLVTDLPHLQLPGWRSLIPH